jgi:hypothetical protein
MQKSDPAKTTKTTKEMYNADSGTVKIRGDDRTPK